MKINGIYPEKCILCGECINECPPGLFSREKSHGKGGVVYNNPLDRCIRCGHCIAVCKPGAINYEAEETAFTFENIDHPEKIVPFDSIFKFLAIRRSVRRFKDKPVDREDLEAVFKAMQYAPSASNARRWQYIAVTDRQKIAWLSAKTLDLFKMMRSLINLRWLLWPFLPGNIKKMIFSPSMKGVINEAIAEYKKGKDFIFFHAPCILILHAPVYGSSISGNDAGIALTYGMLAAQSRGLGSCWIGFAQEAIERKPEVQRWLSLPKQHKVYGVLALGYPDVKYFFIPPRSELEVRYM